MTENVVVATFLRPWDAEVARQSLEQAGIPAWVEGSGLDDPYRGGPVSLMVPVEWAEDAHLALAEPVEDDEEETLRPARRRRPLWVAVVATLVVAGLAIPSVPRFLWVPILLVTFIGLLLWQLVRPAPPGDSSVRQ
ncbi:MAG: hypothetical protein ACRDI0_10725 [Actinomycetota bacterium]